MDFWLILFIFDGILFMIIAGTVLYMGVFAVAALFHSKPSCSPKPSVSTTHV